MRAPSLFLVNVAAVLLLCTFLCEVPCANTLIYPADRFGCAACLLLVQALSGGAIPGGPIEGKVGTGRKWSGKSWSNTVIVINPALMMDLQQYKARVAEVRDPKGIPTT